MSQFLKTSKGLEFKRVDIMFFDEIVATITDDNGTLSKVDFLTGWQNSPFVGGEYASDELKEFILSRRITLSRFRRPDNYPETVITPFDEIFYQRGTNADDQFWYRFMPLDNEVHYDQVKRGNIYGKPYGADYYEL